LNSSSPECSSIEESSQIPLLSSTVALPSGPQQQQQNSVSSNLSGTIDSFDDKTSKIQTG